LSWTADKLVWVDQWPPNREKLHALETLVEEQLSKGNIVPPDSRWNSPVFIIRKPGKDRWRLLHDLRRINEVIADMGPLQPGLPSPTMLPRTWKLAVIDIKDCFFHIPLHPEDTPRFAFSVPSINRQALLRRFHWHVLSQGMKNSPSICQWYVAGVLSPVRQRADKAILYHYMDDLLICAETEKYLDWTLDITIKALENAGFSLQPDEIQRVCPVRERTVIPQPLVIKDNPRTLRDLHQLCGSINWVRPLLGIRTETLAPLFNLLAGDNNLDSPRTLTEEAHHAIAKVQEAITNRQAHRTDPRLPFNFIVLGECPHFSGLICQWDAAQKDPLLIIEWIFLPHKPSKSITRPQELVAQLIMRARVCLRALAGRDFECLNLPFTNAALEHLMQFSQHLQIALEAYTGRISINHGKHKLFNTLFRLAPKEKQSRTPLKALTIFTDGSGGSHQSVMTCRDPKTQQWEADVQVVEGSPQIAELAAVVRAFERFPEPLNIVTDSAYVAGVVSRAENALLKEVSNPKLYKLLSTLVYLLSHREQPYYVMHVRSHSDLPG
ncbi:POK18 protein, partial [Gymnorhina tibicen]|nr:POK18 protein [Gymnorhina tibicen]